MVFLVDEKRGQAENKRGSPIFKLSHQDGCLFGTWEHPIQSTRKACAQVILQPFRIRYNKLIFFVEASYAE